MKPKFRILLLMVIIVLSFVAVGLAGYISRPDAQPPITSAVCDPSLIRDNGVIGDTNITAMLYIDSSGDQKSWSMQDVCDGRSVKVDAAQINVTFDESTRFVHVTWSANLPVEWKAIALVTRSGPNPPVKLEKPTDSSYSRELQADEHLSYVFVYGHAPTLPPSSVFSGSGVDINVAVVPDQPI